MYNNFGGFKFYDPGLLNNMTQKQVRSFLQQLVLCHTVLAREGQDQQYQSSSMDEEAQVIASACFGFSLKYND